MIPKRKIEENLDQLDRRFRSAKYNKDRIYFAKLAILETSGWVEVTIDSIVDRAMRRNTSTQQSRDYIRDKIKNTYGFDAKKNFTPLMVCVFGVVGMEKIEKRIGEYTVSNFKSELTNLSKSRNELAHTYSKKSNSRNYDAPSVTRGRFDRICAGLEGYDCCIRIVFK